MAEFKTNTFFAFSEPKGDTSKYKYTSIGNVPVAIGEKSTIDIRIVKRNSDGNIYANIPGDRKKADGSFGQAIRGELRNQIMTAVKTALSAVNLTAKNIQ